MKLLFKNFAIISFAVILTFGLSHQQSEFQINSDRNLVKSFELDTNSGPIIGLAYNSSKGERHYKFLGIPYAEPPVGKLRFQDPAPKKPWNKLAEMLPEPINTTSFGSMCFQIDPFTRGRPDMSEDCLFLNVYTSDIPKRARQLRRSTLKPVMVFIHGGEFLTGSGNDYSPEYFLGHDIVFVTINYRLGLFGFMSLDDKMLSGNQGLKDQLEALKWVRKNIAHFGGNPDKVTIMGESAGAVSAHLHVLSHQGFGLYHNAILQSGTALSPLQINSRLVKDSSLKLVEEANCMNDTSVEEILDCLGKLDGETLFEVYKNSEMKSDSDKVKEMKKGNRIYKFEPVVDKNAKNPFLLDQPMNILTTGNFKRLPIMIGLPKDAGIGKLGSLYGDVDSLDWQGALLYYLMNINPRNITFEEELISNMTLQYYIGKQDKIMKGNDVEKLIELFTDMSFGVGAFQLAKIYSEFRIPAYLYELTHRPTLSYSSVWFYNTKYTTKNIGVSLGDDLILLFKSNFGPYALQGEADQKVSELMIELWTNFSKYREPTPYHSEHIPHWEPFDSEEQCYMELKSSPELKKKFHPVKMTFWEKVILDELIDESNSKGLMKQFSNNRFFIRGLFKFQAPELFV